MNKEISRSIEISPHIESWQTSGLTQKAYCDQHKIILHVFYYWLKRYRLKQEPAGEKGFLSVSLRSVKSPGSASMELIGTNGNRILFYGNVEPSYIKSLLS